MHTVSVFILSGFGENIDKFLGGIIGQDQVHQKNRKE
jgi:hypothetical protein